LQANLASQNQHQRNVMFGNRKRKHQEDEESLVPHGLIWHATEEPATPEEAAKSEEALGYTVNYAQEIERARREQSAQSIDQAPSASQSPTKPGVIPWWRVESPEPPVERPISKLAPMPLSAYVPTPIESDIDPARAARIQPMQIRPTQGQPVPAQPIRPISAAVPEVPTAQAFQASAPQVEGSLAKSVQVYASPISEPILRNRPEPQAKIAERLLPKFSGIKDAIALAFSRLRSVGKTAWLNMSLISGKAVQRGGQRVQSLELGEGLARLGKQGQSLMHGCMTRTRSYARTTGGALGTFSRAGVSRVRQISDRVRTGSTTAHGDVVRPANTRPSTPSRVRVLLAASALQARIIAAQQLSAWRIRRERMAVDSRFWASMTLSAIAAIIALVIVSVVPHYAAKSLPSRLLNTNPSVDANVAAPAAAAPAPVQKTAAPVRKAAITSTQAVASKPTLASATTKTSTNPKPKHLVQDDYVAPNTYKYYGTGSKR
jgi:hypothetical protein